MALVSDVVLVSIVVLPVNDGPVLASDYGVTNEEQAVWVAVLANDYDVDG